MFPGVSLEMSLDFIVDEYTSFENKKQTLFVEVRKHKQKGNWLF